MGDSVDVTHICDSDSDSDSDATAEARDAAAACAKAAAVRATASCAVVREAAAALETPPLSRRALTKAAAALEAAHASHLHWEKHAKVRSSCFLEHLGKSSGLGAVPRSSHVCAAPSRALRTRA